MFTFIGLYWISSILVNCAITGSFAASGYFDEDDAQPDRMLPPEPEPSVPNAIEEWDAQWEEYQKRTL